MIYNVGDEIILSEEQVLSLIKYYDTNRALAEGVMKIIEISHRNYYMIEVARSYPEENIILTLKGTKNFRLATNSEIKRDQIKKIFVN